MIAQPHPTPGVSTGPNLASPLTLADVAQATEAALSAFFADAKPVVAEVSPAFTEAVEALQQFVLLGGKRVRPACAFLGWRCAGGPTAEISDSAAVSSFAALELIQACALIHDDVIDRSDTRRGRPTVHRVFERLHAQAGYSGSSGHYGVSTAVLLGDIALAWADDMLSASPITPDALARLRPIWMMMRTQVLGGQYLDIRTEASRDESIDAAYLVMRFKTAGYTVSSPMQLGAALADADPILTATLADAGIDLGLAFQLRDDILGVFGDPARTGKPSGDDLVAGKRTVLLAAALRRADNQNPSAAAQLRSSIGRDLTPAEIERAKGILVEIGAVDEVEAKIDELLARALGRVTESIAPREAVEDLRHFAARLTQRDA